MKPEEGGNMRYAEAIMICDKIDLDRIGGREIDTDTKLDAIQKILSMETINAVKKETLVKVIRWFWNNCVEVESNDS